MRKLYKKIQAGVSSNKGGLIVKNTPINLTALSLSSLPALPYPSPSKTHPPSVYPLSYLSSSPRVSLFPPPLIVLCLILLTISLSFCYNTSIPQIYTCSSSPSNRIRVAIVILAFFHSFCSSHSIKFVLLSTFSFFYDLKIL